MSSEATKRRPVPGLGTARPSARRIKQTKALEGAGAPGFPEAVITPSEMLTKKPPLDGDRAESTINE